VVFVFGTLVVGVAATVIVWDMAGQPTPQRIFRRLKRRFVRGPRRKI